MSTGWRLFAAEAEITIKANAMAPATTISFMRSGYPCPPCVFGETLVPIMTALGANSGQPMVSKVHNIIQG